MVLYSTLMIITTMKRLSYFLFFLLGLNFAFPAFANDANTVDIADFSVHGSPWQSVPRWPQTCFGRCGRHGLGRQQKRSDLPPRWRFLEEYPRSAEANLRGKPQQAVWGVNRNDQIYYWNGSNWTKVDGLLKYVSVASDGTVWGVNKHDHIYRRSGNGWTRIQGALKQVSVGKNGKVWGVNASNHIYRWNGGSGTGNSWSRIQGSLKHVSVAADGTVWGVNTGDKIYRWKGGNGTGNTWENVPGLLKQICSGSSSKVWGVNKNDQIYYLKSNWRQEIAASSSSNTNTNPGEVAFFNEGGYAARFFVTYTLNGAKKSFKSGSKPIGKRWNVNIPAGATSVTAKAERHTGFKWSQIFYVTFPSPPKICYKVYGTTLSPKYNNKLRRMETQQPLRHQQGPPRQPNREKASRQLV